MTHVKFGHAEHRERSCYILELSIVPSPLQSAVNAGPKPARRADVFVYNRLVHIHRCLEYVLVGAPVAMRAETMKLTLAGQAFTLWVVEEGRVIGGVDLRPHIGIRVDGAAPARLPEVIARDEAWRDSLAGHDLAFELDWDAVAKATPALQGEPLHPGETIALEADEDVLAPFDSYLEVTEDLAYGYEDLESGRKVPSGFVDPDPPRGRA